MIGIFDSGVGGLTVVREIKKLLPDVPIVYFGDTARLPYGNKSQETIQRYSAEIAEFLKSKGCRTIVIACNSASALAADHIREKYPELKIYDVVSSGAEAAAEATRSKKVGVIGTTATIGSSIYKKKISGIDPEIEIFTKACPLFVPLVEENWIRRPETKKIARAYLRELKLKKIDTLLLGCTHYPLLERIISGAMGRRTKVVASGERLAKKLASEQGPARNASPARSPACFDLRSNSGRAASAAGWRSEAGRDEYFVSDLTAHFEKLAGKILGRKVNIKKAKI